MMIKDVKVRNDLDVLFWMLIEMDGEAAHRLQKTRQTPHPSSFHKERSSLCQVPNANERQILRRSVIRPSCPTYRNVVDLL